MSLGRVGDTILPFFLDYAAAGAATFEPYVGFAPKNNDNRVQEQSQVQTPFSLQAQKKSMRTRIVLHAWALSLNCEARLESKF